MGNSNDKITPNEDTAFERAKQSGKLIFEHNKWKFHHKVNQLYIDCPHMIKSNSNDAVDCPVFYAVRNQHQFSQTFYTIITQYAHLLNDMV